MTILDEILERKRDLVGAAQAQVPADRLRREAVAVARPPAGFRRALRDSPPPRIIAELKRRSPSKGEIRADYDPVVLARAYAEGGAAALSVLTDEPYFGGSLDDLRAARGATGLPILRKDFVIGPYQIDEARVAGADAVLLIVKALSQEDLVSLHAHARGLGLDVLVEVHDEEELDRAAACGADLIGINNRDLTRFTTDLAVTERLLPKAPAEAVVVTESGIMTFEDVSRLSRAGAHGFLVGESLMRQADVTQALSRLRGTF